MKFFFLLHFLNEKNVIMRMTSKICNKYEWQLLFRLLLCLYFLLIFLSFKIIMLRKWILKWTSQPIFCVCWLCIWIEDKLSKTRKCGIARLIFVTLTIWSLKMETEMMNFDIIFVKNEKFGGFSWKWHFTRHFWSEILRSHRNFEGNVAIISFKISQVENG